MMLSDVCLTSVAYIGHKSKTERPRKTKIGKEVAHVTRDLDTTFNVKRSRLRSQGRGHIVAASRTACFTRDVKPRGLASTSRPWPWLRTPRPQVVGLGLKLNEAETKTYEDFLIVSVKISSLD